MTKIGRRARERRNKTIIVGALALVVSLFVVAAAAYWVLNKPAPLDSKTLCPASGPLGHHVLLVDKTDPLTFTQRQSFEVVLKDLIERKTPEGYLLSVFVLGEDFTQTAKPLIELCNPGNGAGRSELNANLSQLKRQYEERFLGPLLQQSTALIATKPAKASPIVEMLQLVSINAFKTHNVKENRRLIILSDMLHNTPQFSMYKTNVDFSDFSATDYGRKSHVDLQNVNIEIHYLMNSPQFQTKRNVKFWEDFFNKSGARLVAVNPLEG